MNIKLIIAIIFILFETSPGEQQTSRQQIPEKENKPKYQVQCTKREKASDEEQDPILIKTCNFKNYTSVRTGRADYKGRYSYQYELYKIDENGRQKIENSELFNSSAELVEKRINKDLRQEYEKNLANPQLKDCMEWIDLRHYKLDEMGIAFSDNNKIEFYIDHGIGGACFNVSSSFLTYTISEFKEYL